MGKYKLNEQRGQSQASLSYAESQEKKNVVQLMALPYAQEALVDYRLRGHRTAVYPVG